MSGIQTPCLNQASPGFDSVVIVSGLFAHTLSSAGEVNPPLEMSIRTIWKHLFCKQPFISTMKNNRNLDHCT